MTAWRTLGICAGWLAFVSLTQAQTYTLSETPKVGETVHYTIDTTVEGVLKIPQEGKILPIKISVIAKHEFDQRTLMIKNDAVVKAARYYQHATNNISIGTERIEHRLRDNRQLMIAQQPVDSLLCYSPGGVLTRDEEELVAQHLDSMRLTGILPSEPMPLDKKWKLPNSNVQALCFFDGLISHDVQAYIKEVKEGAAIIQLEGKADGIELGAKVSANITATVTYELLPKRITAISWTRKDDRNAGPVNPASEMTSQVTMKRTVVEEVKELMDHALVSVPKEFEVPAALNNLILKDHKPTFQMLHSRDWHVVSMTDTHTVLRLLDRGDFIAQATIATWRQAEPGKHLAPEQFKEVVTRQAGWELEEVVDESEIPTDNGRWLYRITARGSINDMKVTQTFYCLANEDGRQLMVTFIMKPTHSTKIGTRDIALVNAIDFVK